VSLSSLKITSRTLSKSKYKTKCDVRSLEKLRESRGKKMRFQTTLEGAECLRRSDAGWQSVPGTRRSDEERAVTSRRTIHEDGMNKVDQNQQLAGHRYLYYAPTVGMGALSVAFVRLSVRSSLCTSVAYIANNSRTQRPIACPNLEGRSPTVSER